MLTFLEDVEEEKENTVILKVYTDERKAIEVLAKCQRELQIALT